MPPDRTIPGNEEPQKFTNGDHNDAQPGQAHLVVIR